MYYYDDNPNIDKWHEEKVYYGFDKIIGNARIKSTKKNIKISYNGQTVSLSKKGLKMFFIQSSLYLIALVAAASLLWKIGSKTVEKVDYQLDVLSVRTEECKETEIMLKNNNLNTEPNANREWYNDYSCLTGLSEDDIYGFYYYLGYDETENVLKTLGYTSWEHFLSSNGYFGHDGRPSIEVWENYAENKLVVSQRKALENGRKY